MNQFPLPANMDLRYPSHSNHNHAKSARATEGIVAHHHYHHPQAMFASKGLPYPAPSPPTVNHSNLRCSTETAVSEALLTLSSAGPNANDTQAAPPVPFQSPPPQYQAPHPRQQRQLSGAPSGLPPLRRVSLCSPVTANGGYHHPQQPQPQAWPQPFFPQQQHPTTTNHMNMPRGNYDTPKRAPSPAMIYHHHGRPVMVAEEAVAPPPAKKARTVSPLPAPVPLDSAPPPSSTSTSTNTSASNHNSSTTPQETICTPTPHHTVVSCICPVCNMPIKGLGDHKVDWSQPVQGRQRAKTITSIKKHVKDFHPNEPIWNVIVNSLDVPSKENQRIVTAQAFVTQALKKAALDQIPNHPHELRSFRWTEKMMDQRVGIAKGFIQFGGQEYLRNKDCHDEMGRKINPKSLRNLAYSLLQAMYNDLMARLGQNQPTLQAAMATAPLGLLRNRFQLLFAAPDKWNQSWYMEPALYSNQC